MNKAEYNRDTAREIPPRLPQDVIDEIMNRPSESICHRAHDKSTIINMLEQDKVFFKDISYETALEKAIEFAKDGGFIATFPQLIALMAERKWFLFGQECVSPYSQKITGNVNGEQITLISHGSGLTEALLLPKLNISQDIFEDLIRGKLPNNKPIEIYTLDDVKKGKVKDPFGMYGILLNELETAKYPFGMQSFYKEDKEEFLSHCFVLAAAGTPEYLEAFFNKSIHGVIISWRDNFSNKDIPRYEIMKLGFSIDGPKRKPASFANYLPTATGNFIAVNPNKEAPQ